MCEKKLHNTLDLHNDVSFSMENRFTLGIYRTVSKKFICGSAKWVFRHKKIIICCFFFENGGDDKNDNHILVGNVLSVACSESTRCRGLTIFENEAVNPNYTLFFL